MIEKYKLSDLSLDEFEDIKNNFHWEIRTISGNDIQSPSFFPQDFKRERGYLTTAEDRSVEELIKRSKINPRQKVHVLYTTNRRKTQGKIMLKSIRLWVWKDT